MMKLLVTLALVIAVTRATKASLPKLLKETKGDDSASVRQHDTEASLQSDKVLQKDNLQALDSNSTRQSGANHPTACNGAQKISSRRLRIVKEAFSIYSWTGVDSYILNQLRKAGESVTSVILEPVTSHWLNTGSGECVELGKYQVWIA